MLSDGHTDKHVDLPMTENVNYLLALNDMRAPNIENLTAVKWATDRQLIVDWYIEQIGPWQDGRWGKTFRAGTPLEWYNAGDLNEDNAYFGGIYLIPDHVSEQDALAARWTKA